MYKTCCNVLYDNGISNYIKSFSVLPETNRKLPTDITEVAELSADRFSCLEVGGTNVEMGTGRVKIDTRSCERNLDGISVLQK